MWVPKITNTMSKLLGLCLRKDEQKLSQLKEKRRREFLCKILEFQELSLSLEFGLALSLRGLVEFYVL